LAPMSTCLDRCNSHEAAGKNPRNWGAHIARAIRLFCGCEDKEIDDK